MKRKRHPSRPWMLSLPGQTSGMEGRTRPPIALSLPLRTHSRPSSRELPSGRSHLPRGRPSPMTDREDIVPVPLPQRGTNDGSSHGPELLVGHRLKPVRAEIKPFLSFPALPHFSAFPSPESTAVSCRHKTLFRGPLPGGRP